MATPNIVNVATINAKNATANLTGTSRTEAIDVPADKVAKINTILVANIDGSNAADITIEVSVDNGSNYVKLANTISVPADATLSFLENPIYLDETDLLYFTASAANDLSYFVSYELLDDAQEVLQAMANGGVIGPIQTVGSTPVSARVSTFNSSGTFTAQAPSSANYLIIGGGGSGGSSNAGGGGAGGYRASGFGPSPLRGSAFAVVKGQSYTVTVGAGGAQSTAGFGYSGNNGNASSVFCIESAGGGKGQGFGNYCHTGGPGGSGGGGGGRDGTPTGGSTVPGGSGNTPPTDPPQGNDGGDGFRISTTNAGGGGGGAGAAGGNSPGANNGGTGGAGVTNNITGSCVTYGGGGGGSTGGGSNYGAPQGTAGGGGPGGGGAAGAWKNNGTAGSANTGGGGGAGATVYCGSGSHCGPSYGGAGGSGKVVISEPASSFSIAPGMWTLAEVYDLRKTGDWTGF